ncbi:MAG: type I restriction-modification system endonuclease [Phormidesmis sp.]
MADEPVWVRKSLAIASDDLSSHNSEAISMRGSQNFAFLKLHSLALVRLGTLAENYFATDPNTCLIKLRQFGEQLAQLVAAKVGLYENPDESQFELLRRLENRGAITGQATQLFQEIRRVGNRATHDSYDEQGTALSHLKYARSLGIWFHRSYGGARAFKPGPFIPPPDPVQETTALKTELERLRAELAAGQAELAASQSQAELAQVQAQEEAELRQIAEELLLETEAKAEEITAQFEVQLRTIQAEAVQAPTQVIDSKIITAQRVEPDLDERETRRLIDAQLRAVGWEVDTETLTYGQGTRPQKGKNLAIAEWPTTNGWADYVLFVGLCAIATIEAKRRRKDVSGAIDQAKRYSRGYEIKGDETLPDGPWGEYKIPFVFATNGRAFLAQLETKSGIWFCDVRKPENLRRALRSWYSPAGLVDTLAQDVDKADAQLAQEPFNYGFDLRDYQIKAILAAEGAIAQGQRNLLLAMATGTGKTKTCIALVYRLLKTKRFRRVLFLVDRTALGEQAANAFKDTRMESLQTFADIFEIKDLEDADTERETKVHIATVQSFVKRLLYPSEPVDSETSNALSADQYDCIVVDECHRGYLLDRELSDTELSFRDFGDYVSKYRAVLEYFDAVKIGLTATPALHTAEIFGTPVFSYSYREAVIDGYLIDHEPPIRPVTALAEDGITWHVGEDVEYFDPKTGQLNLAQAPDEIKVDVAQFNRKVITPEFNRVVCDFLAEQIDPEMGKTLIFCVNNDHADLVMNLLKDSMQKRYGSINDDDVKKITGASDQPMQLIRRYKNEASPKIAVTVDLMTTGIDVPEICNIVFLRRVKSRILYEQMLGRATRLCDEIDKTFFRVFDPVGLYQAISEFSTMKPVVVNPKISFVQLVDELGAVSEPSAAGEILDQLVAKLQRKKRHLSEAQTEGIESLAGMPVDEVADYLKQCEALEAASWFKQRQQIAKLLDRQDGGGNPMLVSYHADELRRVEQGFGVAEDGTEYGKPEDYLESFAAFIENNKNIIPALMVVTQRPRDLTRQQLKALQLALADAGYSETMLKAAWREKTNEDIAASIIGYVRQAALGDALVPYEERVQRAIKKILASQKWSAPQRKWLERIGKQLEKEYVVDREAFDRGAFKREGGFQRLNKVFEGKLEVILEDISLTMWGQQAGL